MHSEPVKAGISLDQLPTSTLAQLLASVGTHKKTRPFDPITVAHYLRDSGMSNRELARRLSVTPQTIRMFLNLLKLDEDLQTLVANGAIGRDQGDRLSRISDRAPQRFLAEAIVHQALSPEIIKEVVSLKNRNPSLAIETALLRVLEAQPVVETHHVLATQVAPTVLQDLEKHANARGEGLDELIGHILGERLIKQNVVSVFAKPGLLLVILTQAGWKRLEEVRRDHPIPLERFVELTVSNWLAEAGD